MICYHYTNAIGLAGIIASGTIRSSTLARNPGDVRYGDGQYLSDIVPGTKSPSQLSRLFLNLPFFGQRFTHFVALEVDGLPLVEGRPGVFVIPNDAPLDVSDRIVASGPVPDLAGS